jgi:hypothetical protein
MGKVLRILASLAINITAPSRIVSKLSPYKKTTPTLKVFDKIIMTDYLPDYLDSKEIRDLV